MKEIMRLGSILLLICFVAAALLAMTNDVTYPKIMEQRQMANEKARKEVLPTADSFEELSGEELAAVQAENDKVDEIFIGKSGDLVVGYVVKHYLKDLVAQLKYLQVLQLMVLYQAYVWVQVIKKHQDWVQKLSYQNTMKCTMV